MSARSRNKGAQFERALAHELHARTGVSFKRNLEQCREAELGDLIPDDPQWPFLIEAKHHANGTDARNAWVEQVLKAADGSGLYPALAWKFDRHPVRVRVWWDALAEGFGGQATRIMFADLSIPAFAVLASEIMAARAASGAAQ